MPLSISACIITLNEEDTIARCISSLSFVSEVIVLDSGSTDRTKELAEKLGALVEYRKFDDYVAQKNYVVSLARNNWILTIDADEEVSPKLAEEIYEYFGGREPEEDGFLIPRLTMYMGRWIRHGGWYPNYKVRLFRKEKGKFEGGKVHESVTLTGKGKKLENPLFHYSYQNLSDHLNFINRYSDLSAQEKFAKGKRIGLFVSLGKAFYKFAWMYLVRFGFLDGRRGLVLAIMGFYYNFLKYAKVFEMSLTEKDRIRDEKKTNS
ncbi:glycosyl transferase [Leptospira perolatii]|uniref:Glycosyl transferase n=1 Tax=Leptospira perolatii TaxID=2023191 RepID=A0A2M9ZSP8_9LEPT|nr:glycosyltransferase family 2 protein [Leptospira perolatii]PJZ68741.1 glycosyl transferase [Leptospira perolatii]PJZ75096.1 glycosyl transferase [Leptospira perolatii]